jgi:hypothetical protein
VGDIPTRANIIVRRRQADANRTASDIVVQLEDEKGTARALRGLWSDADPEVLVDGIVVARLRTREAIEDLVDLVLERFHS